MTERRPTRKEAKQAERDAYAAHVRSALEDAHLAAEAAFARFMQSAPLTPDGFVGDLCGGAMVGVYKPSYRLRTTLQAIGEIEKDYKGAWYISNFSRHVIRQQSITAHEETCRAACAVLQERLSGEGQFFARRYMT